MKPTYLLMILWILGSISSLVHADELQESLNKQRDLNAVQKVYIHGVPHTDSRGNFRTAYDSQSSFFQIGMWGAPSPDKHYDWAILKKAGFNTVWPWLYAQDPSALLEAGKKNDLQIILKDEPQDEILEKIKNNPQLLGIVWMDEPIGKFGNKVDMEELFQKYQTYRQRVHRIIPNLPVFVNDAPWITPPATTWWLKWNTSSEVSCHDNYPVLCFRHNVRSIGLNPNAIPQTVSLAVAANKEQKPVWLIVGAFEQGYKPGDAFPFRYPTPEQLRAQVYAGLIHGATGIVYFIWDSYIGRPGKIFGMSPNPEIKYDPQCGMATPIQMIKARALWETTVQINRELAELTPALLSPTDSELNYKVHIEGEAVTDTPIRTLLKKNPNGGYILLTVNLDDAMLNVTYTFPNPLKDVQVLFENSRVISPQPSSIDHFTLHYEPFETHVIQISPN